MEKELKEIYALTLMLQAKVIDLKNKVSETTNKLKNQKNETTNIYKKVG